MDLGRELVGSYKRMKLVDSANDTSVLSLLYFIFFYCMQIWPMMMDNDFARCLYIRYIVSLRNI